MSEHNIFYYPYATLGTEQSMLLKVAALYFDKLFILDPTKASWAAIGPGGHESDLRMLESEGILQRISPENVLHQHEQIITDAIQRDLVDDGFQKLCAEKANSRWTLALAKVPKDIRENPSFKPIDSSMKNIMTNFAGGYVEGYTEGKSQMYDETRGKIEYRYADYPFPVGEAIMLNHALIGSLLHVDAIPITDDPLHSSILNYKLQKVQTIPAIRTVLESYQKQQQFAGITTAASVLTDMQLCAIPEGLHLEEILKYRQKHNSELKVFREKLGWMAREITRKPWTKDFNDEVYHKIIPSIQKELQPVKNSWASWLKVSGIALGGAIVVLGIFGNPLTPVAIGVAGLTIAKDIGIGGFDWYQDWKTEKTRNGLHYLIRLKK